MINLKKVMSGTAAFGLVFSLFAVPILAEASGIGVVTGKIVNFRQSPALTASVISEIQQGTKVDVISSSGSWYKASYKGETGWIHNDYLSVSKEKSAAGTAAATVSTDVLNVRSTPSLSAKIVIQLDRGNTVSVLERSDIWCKVKTAGGTTGWAYGEYVSEAKTAANTVKAAPVQSKTLNGTGTVTTDILNLRSTPSLSAKSVTQLEKGNKVTLLERSGTWYKVRTSGGTVGYLHSDYLSVGSAAKSVVTASRSSSIITGTVSTDVLNVRSTASLSAKTVGKLEKGNRVTVLERSGSWCKVKTSGGTTGWVHSDYIAIGKAETVAVKAAATVKTTVSKTVTGTGTVTTDVLNMRSTPSQSAKSVTQLEKGDRVTLLERSDVWYKVKTSGGKTGWVHSEYLQIQKSTVSRGVAATRESSDQTDKGEQIAAYAKRFLGVPYVWGGTSPEGFDCSGFVYYVYKHFGITMQRVASSQACQGAHVSKSDLKPGDLIFADTEGANNGDITHVGIYIGGGKFIHASNPRSDVKITDLSESFYENAYVTARRIVK